jgi:hypothetical protein
MQARAVGDVGVTVTVSPRQVRAGHFWVVRVTRRCYSAPMLRRRRPVPPSPGQRVTDDDFLAILRDKIRSVAPALVKGCRIGDGVMTGRPGPS